MRAALALFALVAWPALAATSTPTSLQIDCTTANGTNNQTNPGNCTNWKPRFTWTGGGPAYQIQVDTASTFDAGGACGVWLWDSGATTYAFTTTAVVFPSTGNCATQSQTQSAQAPWVGLRTFYWRVRGIESGQTPSAWSATQTFSYQQLPGPPTGLSVTDGDGTGEGSAGTAPTTTTYDVTNDASLASRISAAAAGDVIRLSSGTYSSNYTVSASGTAVNPVTIKAATSATMSGKLTLTGAYIVVGPGITFTNAAAGAVTQSGSYQLVTGCTFTGTGTSYNGNDNGIVSLGTGSTTSNWFIGNTMAPASDMADSTAAITPKPGTTDIVIRGNDLSGGMQRGVNQTGGQSTLPGSMLVAENHIHAFSKADGGACVSYYGMGDITYARNLIYDTRGGPGAQWVRGSWPRFIGNTIGRDGGDAMYCYKPDDADGQTTIDGDSCLHTQYAFDISPVEWTLSHKILWRYSNHYWATGRSHDGVTNSATCGVATGSACISYVTTGAGKVTAVDPQLVTTLGATVGRPSSSSNPLRNLGPAGYPVAVDGDGTADIGRFAWGAASITSIETYAYDPLWTISGTRPRVSWTFSDPNNTLMSISPAQTQGAWEAQVDPASTFNTAGPFQPFCSSGKVTGTQAFWDVPCTLAANTTYYVRVRTWDNVTDQPGAWSDYAAAFRTGAATTPTRVNGATLRGVTLR